MTVSTHVDMKKNGEGQKKLSLEDILENIGLGPWNYLPFAACMLTGTSYAVNLVISNFTSPKIPFTCADPIEYPGVYYIEGTQCFVSHVMKDGEFSTLPCQKFIFDNTTFPSTVTSQFELVCDRTYLLDLYQMLLTLGFGCGALFGGGLGEKFGRARSFWWAFLGSFLAIISGVLMPWMSVVLITRFLTGFCGSISTNLSFTLALECCPQKQRSFFGIILALPYAMMVGAVGGVAYFIRDWKILTLALYGPMYILFLVGNPWVMSESPRWLMSTNRLGEAERVIRRAGKLNGKSSLIPENLDAQLQAIYQKDFGGECLSLFERFKSLLTSKDMRRLVILETLLWLILGIIYICIPLSVGNFKSPFLTMVLLGVAEVPAYSLSAPITAWLGRRWVAACSLALGGLFFLVKVAIGFSMPDADWIEMGVSAFALWLICTAWQVSQMHRVELFPTTVRSAASTVTYSIAGVGSSLPPVIDSAMESLPENMRWTKQVLYAMLSFIGCFLVLGLRETNNKPLSGSVKEYSHDKSKEQLDKYNKKITKILKNLDEEYLAKIEKDILDSHPKDWDENRTVENPERFSTMFNIEKESSNYRSM